MKELISELHKAGCLIRDVTLANAMEGRERELTKYTQAPGDDEYTLDKKPSEILIGVMDKYGKASKTGIELVGEAYKDTIVGYEKKNSDYIVHVDVIDGTREVMHKVGLSYFEAGVLPWSEEPRLADTIQGLAVVIGHDPIDGRQYSYFSGDRSYRAANLEEKEFLKPTDVADFRDRGYFNIITNFRDMGVLHILKDRVFREIYGISTEPDIFHRETVTSCNELLNLAKGSTRGVMDLRPALRLIAEKLDIPGYESPISLGMHAYDVSGAWPIIRDTKKAVIRFYDENLNELKPGDIKIRELDRNIGYVACGNEELFKKFIGGLEKVLK